MSEPRTMRAAVLTGPGRAEIREVKIPEPAAGQVLVRVQGCGLCGSNLPIWEGRPWFDYPPAPGNPGHEGWGRVVATGSEVTRLRPGQRVAMLSEHALADYDVADESAAVPLPESLAGSEMPAEPLGCAMNAWRRADIREGHTVAVLGVGFLGALLIQMAARAGARVIAISRRPYSRELGWRMGAVESLPLEDWTPVEARVDELTGGAGCDRVIECVGLEGPLTLAARLCRVRGRLIIVGFHQDGMRQVDMQLWNWRGLDVVNAHERDPQAYVDGMRAAIDAISSGRLDPGPLYTHRFDLERVEEAFEHLESRPQGFVKALVTT